MAEENDGQERTEEATPRKREQALEQGQVPRSRDLTTTVLLLGAAWMIMLLVALLFLSMNGHLVLLQYVLESYRVSATFTPLMAGEMVKMATFMFSGALLVALPAVTALLLVNLAFGVLTRAAPQLNVFSLGFPMTLMFGVVVMWVSSAGWLPQFDALSREFFALLNSSFR